MHRKNLLNFPKNKIRNFIRHKQQQQKNKYKTDKTLLGHCNKSTHHATKIQFSSQKRTKKEINDIE